jgi:hypothetical protein
MSAALLRGLRLKTGIQLVSFSSFKPMPLNMQARVRSVQGGRPLLGALVALVVRADKLAVPAVEDRPTIGLDLLGDEPLTAKRHRGDLDLLFGVSILGRTETDGSPSCPTHAAKPRRPGSRTTSRHH